MLSLQDLGFHCPYCDALEYGVFRHGETWTEKDPCVKFLCNVSSNTVLCVYKGVAMPLLLNTVRRTYSYRQLAKVIIGFPLCSKE